MEEPKVEENEADKALRRAFRELEELPIPDEPILHEELLAYHLGELTEADAETLRERLVWDRTALACLREIQHPEALDIETPERGPAEIAEDWHAIQALLGSEADNHGSSEATRDDETPGVVHTSRLPWHRRVETFQRIAAVLALIVLGLGWRLERLEDRLDLQSEPAVNVALVPISPIDSAATHRKLAPLDRVVLPAQSDHVVLLLSYAGFDTFDRYHALLVHEPEGDSPRPFDLGTVTRAPEGGFTVYLSRPWIKDGAYELRLFGTKNQEESLLASYRFSVDAQ